MTDIASPTVRPLLLRRLRILTGLILLLFVTGHLLNAALGVASIAAMDAARPYLTSFWADVPFSIILMGAALIHASLGLWSVYRRPTLHTSAQDVVQILTSLCIVPLTATHAVSMFAFSNAGAEPSYALVIKALWIDAPALGLLQVIVLSVVWVHGCAGLMIWLRSKETMRHVLPWIYPVVVAIPIAALLGYSEAGRAALAGAASENEPASYGSEYGGYQTGGDGYASAPDTGYGRDSGGYESTSEYGAGSDAYGEAGGNAPAIDMEAIQRVTEQMIWISIALALLTLAARWLRLRLRPTQPVDILHNGQPLETSRSGPSVLDLVRLQNVPHASLCEGRGRCGTCAVRILSSEFPVPEPDALEARAIQRRGLPQGTRLACQVFPGAGRIEVEALFPPDYTFAEAEEAKTEPSGTSEVAS